MILLFKFYAYDRWLFLEYNPILREKSIFLQPQYSTLSEELYRSCSGIIETSLYSPWHSSTIKEINVFINIYTDIIR